jgi:hypothetical protein
MRASGHHPEDAPRRWAVACVAFGLIAAAPAAAVAAQRIHGLWVWKAATVLEAPQGAERLRDFCRAQGITEVYLSVFSHGVLPGSAALAASIELLHRADVRVEALLSSTDADEPGKHRETLLGHVRAIVTFDQQHPRSRFDGIHLDIEPQQRAENKGAGNLRFLPGLLETFRAVRTVADAAGLTVNADIQNKLLKGSADQRRALLQSLPRLTLMLYELTSASEAGSRTEKEQLLAASHAYLEGAYQDVRGSGFAGLVIALRTSDYGERLPQMLAALDDANGTNPYYLGWARHSYNDTLADAP